MTAQRRDRRACAGDNRPRRQCGWRAVWLGLLLLLPWAVQGAAPDAAASRTVAAEPEVVCSGIAPFAFLEQGQYRGYAYELGQAVMRTEARVPFRGWRMVAFTPYSSVRDRVNAVIALEIMGFAIILALGFYQISRRAKVQSAVYRRESAELRALNARLSRARCSPIRCASTSARMRRRLAAWMPSS